MKIRNENDKFATNLTFIELWLFTYINMLVQQSEAQNRIQFI